MGEVVESDGADGMELAWMPSRRGVEMENSQKRRDEEQLQEHDEKCDDDKSTLLPASLRFFFMYLDSHKTVRAPSLFSFGNDVDLSP